MHVQRVAHYSPTLNVLAFGQDRTLTSTTIWNYSSNLVYLGVESLWKKLEIQILNNIHRSKWLILLWYCSGGICGWELEVTTMLGKGLGFSLSSWSDNHHRYLNSLLQISHTPCPGECGKLFWLHPQNAIHSYSCCIWEDRYQYTIRWSCMQWSEWVKVHYITFNKATVRKTQTILTTILLCNIISKFEKRWTFLSKKDSSCCHKVVVSLVWTCHKVFMKTSTQHTEH